MKFSDHIRFWLMPKAKPAMTRMPGVTLYGDSIMHGGIGDRLRAAGIYVHDLSQPGDTAANAWRRFAYDIRHTAIVVLQQGTNDVTAGIDPVPYLKRMAWHALTEGRRVVLTELVQRADGKGTSVNTQLWQSKIDNAEWSKVPLTSPDGLHPDEPMRDKLTQTLIETIKGMK